MYRVVHKAMSYITQGAELLVFEHRDFPEAGIQVPSGTIRPGEASEDAAVREAWEETGLDELRVVSYLESYLYDMKPYRDEVQQRHVFHLTPAKPAPRSWTHFEQHDGTKEPTAFCYYWVALNDPPVLMAGQGDFLHKLDWETPRA